MIKRSKISVAFCKSCNKVAEPKSTSIASAKPIVKCAICNSLNIRQAVGAELLNIVKPEPRNEGMKIFGV